MDAKIWLAVALESGSIMCMRADQLAMLAVFRGNTGDGIAHGRLLHR